MTTPQAAGAPVAPAVLPSAPAPPPPRCVGELLDFFDAIVAAFTYTLPPVPPAPRPPNATDPAAAQWLAAATRGLEAIGRDHVLRLKLDQVRRRIIDRADHYVSHLENEVAALRGSVEALTGN